MRYIGISALASLFSNPTFFFEFCLVHVERIFSEFSDELRGDLLGVCSRVHFMTRDICTVSSGKKIREDGIDMFEKFTIHVKEFITEFNKIAFNYDMREFF